MNDDVSPGVADDQAPAELGKALRWAMSVLAAAGVPSPQADAVLLAAHLAGISPGEVHGSAILGAKTPPGYASLVRRRAERIPVQHLTGRAAFRRLELTVGPGVFIPRPESELLAGVAIQELTSRQDRDGRRQVMVDLCTGSGAIALAVADETQGVEVHAVELSAEAFVYTVRNVADHGGEVAAVHGDAGDLDLPALARLAGTVDVVTCNPPYIPDGMVPIDLEVRRHDPCMALYGGSADGLTIPLRMVDQAARLLMPGGMLFMEHAEAQGESLPAAVRARGGWRQVEDLPDLTGRPRITVAVKS
ncbi:release factor glutamine methyltransferase [Austwickia chelonae]|uniref:peptide chain release factor N(5)-glutamine methyltransferase n=1 Tax=Austwickia chelonae NBRC 105200 TaxID=1184607 RepID=K6UKV8_9MICO|nr:peptide chain release factor N(5)-glutamine methyltransferase [Austwickia chelonae]GAB76726.1 putative protein methyltransferase [Austwickia chelonae NBRC 105200]SEW29820.1 release factor glutamine methyltransferase [Austwickia chelonae]